MNIRPTVADARFAKPLDTDLIDNLLENHEFLVTIEEGSIGGFASHVANYINNIRTRKTTTIIKNIFFQDKFIDHMEPDDQYKEVQMDIDSIVRKIISLFDNKVINIKNFNKKKVDNIV